MTPMQRITDRHEFLEVGSEAFMIYTLRESMLSRLSGQPWGDSTKFTKSTNIMTRNTWLWRGVWRREALQLLAKMEHSSLREGRGGPGLSVPPRLGAKLTFTV